VADIVKVSEGCEWLKPGREMSLGVDGCCFCVYVEFRMSSCLVGCSGAATLLDGVVLTTKDEL
jgi:hypothetical protein